MFCVEEHKWGYFTRIYIGTLIPRIYIGALTTRRPQVRTRCLPVRTHCTQLNALLTRAYIIFTLRRFFVPCFIFITQYIDNQYFQEMKHWHSMFHF